MNPIIIGGTVEINEVNDFMDKLKSKPYPIQVIKADLLANKDHLVFATEKARESFEKNPISNSLSMEILLYAVGDRQINKAIEKAGVDKGKNKIGLVSFNENEISDLINEIGLKRNDEVLEFKKEKINKIKDVFDITDREIEAVGEKKIPLLVKERIALLDLRK